MRSNEQMKQASSGESLLALDWSALGNLVRARSAMSVSETFLAVAESDGEKQMAVIDQRCESL